MWLKATGSGWILGFILTMRNVNYECKRTKGILKVSFILTMRNVNIKLEINIIDSKKRFILTMRNVNLEVVKEIYVEDRVLY